MNAQTNTVTKTFRELAPKGGKHLEEMTANIAKAIDERASYEKQSEPHNDKIQKTLANIRKNATVNQDIARAFIAAKIEPDFINAGKHTGTRYNVYAIQKVIDVARALVADGGQLGNAINKAIVGSMFAVVKANKSFSMELAKAAASDKVKVDDKDIKKLLTRHTVSASTAPTQASSTMQALQTMGVVKAVGSAKNPAYELLDSPARHALEIVSAAKAAIVEEVKADAPAKTKPAAKSNAVPAAPAVHEPAAA